MSTLARERCLQHPEREAIARCMECRQSFCRECITEHGERLICAACLARLADRGTGAGAKAGRVGALLGVLAGAAVTWAVFYQLGRLLMNTPSAFHEGNLWNTFFE